MNNGRVYLAYFLRLLLVVAIIVSVIWLVYVTVQFAQGELSGDPEIAGTDQTSQEEDNNTNDSDQNDEVTTPTEAAQDETDQNDSVDNDESAEVASATDADLPQTGPLETGIVATAVLSVASWSWYSSRQQLKRAHTRR